MPGSVSGTGDTVVNQASMVPAFTSTPLLCCGSQTWLTLEPLRVLSLTIELAGLAPEPQTLQLILAFSKG